MLKRVLTFLAWCSVWVATTSLAHARLENSSPADKSTVATAPQTLTLKFNETAQLTALQLLHGKEVVPVTLDHAAKPGRTFDLTLPALGPGQYTVQWTAIAADDGHVTKGSFAFTISG